MIDYGSVCSGIESVSVAVHPLGWKPAWFSEIEPFPCAVLEHRFPDVQNHGDMTQLPAKVLRGEIPAPAVLVGGTPCQAFSVAGMRQGLIDPRGALTIKFVELADAIDHVRSARGDAESIVWWENVPGVLSDKGNAFGCFLAALVGESEPLQPSGGKWTDAGCVYGSQRTAAWRVLDAQYFGLAQRRRRVFVVASARKGFDPASVLFESEGVRRDSPPRREAREVAPTIPSRNTGGGGLGTDFDCDGGLIRDWPAEVASTLNASFGNKMGLEDQHALSGAPLFVPATTNNLHGEGFDASEEGTGRVTPRAAGAHAPTIAFHAEAQADQLPTAGRDTSIPDALTCSQRVAVATMVGAYNGTLTDNVAATMGARGSCQSASGPQVLGAMQVRRLTPRECERLMGFPDNHTQIPWRNKPADECPDGPRYKAIGNSKAVPVVRWIARRIQNHI